MLLSACLEGIETNAGLKKQTQIMVSLTTPLCDFG